LQILKHFLFAKSARNGIGTEAQHGGCVWLADDFRLEKGTQLAASCSLDRISARSAKRFQTPTRLSTSTGLRKFFASSLKVLSKPNFGPLDNKKSLYCNKKGVRNA